MDFIFVEWWNRYKFKVQLDIANYLEEVGVLQDYEGFLLRIAVNLF